MAFDPSSNPGVNPNDPDGNVGGGTGPVSNPSSPQGWQTLTQYNLILNQPARVEVVCNCKQGHNGNGDWAFELRIDGTILDSGWGQSPCDKIGLLGSAVVGAGAHTIEFLWAALPNVQVFRPRMSISWTYK